MTEPHRIRAAELFVADGVTVALELLLYAVSFLVPAWLVRSLRGAPLPVVVLASVLGIFVAGVTFLGLLVVLRRLLFPRIRPGRYLIRRPGALPHMLSARLMAMMERSPFRYLAVEVAPVRYAFFRGMGARIDPGFMMVTGSVLADPWLFTAGRGCLLGFGCVVSCHFVQKSVVTLEPVVLGDDVVIGARAFISPGVRIGDGAVVGAGAFVPRGTTIGPGELWTGNPAGRVDVWAAGTPQENR